MNKNKLTLYSAFAGGFGYFLGTILYELFFDTRFADNSIIEALVIVATAALVGISTYFYLKNKYPDLTKELATLEKDERGQFIRGKTSTYTLIFIAALAVILFTYAQFNGQTIFAKMIALAYVLTVLFNIGMNNYLNKKI